VTGDPTATDAGGPLLIPAAGGATRPDPRILPASPVTRFAPAPTGFLHLGHLVNALYVWGIAQATGGRVVLRIEDHDRQRSRPEYETALLDDLERLGLTPSAPPIAAFRSGHTACRQSDNGAAYAAALNRLRDTGIVYACSCTRSTYVRWESERGRSWQGIGCPGGCRAARLDEAEAWSAGPTRPGFGLRVAIGAGSERWVDLLAGPMAEEPGATGDLLVRDRLGNWTYPFCVVVDDAANGVDLVIRGRDLLHATPAQLRLARLLGRETPPTFLHHPLVRRASGQKLSKADHDTAVRSMLDAGATPAELYGHASRLAGLTVNARPIEPDELGTLFGS
jgi:glutamyl-Q tRNA(Asp) synthetase